MICIYMYMIYIYIYIYYTQSGICMDRMEYMEYTFFFSKNGAYPHLATNGKNGSAFI